MLAHTEINRRDAEAPRVRAKWFAGRKVFLLALRLGVSAVIAAVSVGCGSKPTDPRTVIPNDALVYLEASDLGKTLAAVTENPKFQQLAKTNPDMSVLDGVKVAVAVTGFETSEEAVTQENSVLNFQPRFVAVIETNAWGWQASSFVETKLGEFVNEAYGGAIELEITTRNDGEFYVWTSPDGRKAYALQQGSLVFFGNDDTAIERCQAVKRGEAESIAKNSRLPTGERLAFGYVSPEGVGQIANIAGISLAMGASEEDEVKSFVARVLPEILRNSVKEATWSATRKEEGIEDEVIIKLDDESSRVFAETIVPAAAGQSELANYVPASASVATRYLLRDPQVAWRSVVLTTRTKTDETSGGLIGAFSGSLFEPYGVEDAEAFLAGVGTELITVKLEGNTEDAVVIASVRDLAKARRGIAKEINFGKPAEKQFGADLWRSEDGDFAAAFAGDYLVVGDAEIVLKCLEAKQAGGNPAVVQQFSSSNAATVTLAGSADTVAHVVDLLAGRKDENQTLPSTYRTETRFNQNGIERRTLSDFGLIGMILENLATN